MDPQLAALGSPPYGESSVAPAPPPPQADVDDFLRKKRKAREHKACYPCRQRKVKCDLSRPCQTCRDRDHPELCSYHPPNKRQHGDQNATVSAALHQAEDAFNTPQAAPNSYVTIGRVEFDMLVRKLNGLENSMADLRRELKRNSQNDHHGNPDSDSAASNENGISTHTDVHGLHTKNESVSHLFTSSHNGAEGSHKGEIVHLGGGSVPAMLYALGQGQTSGASEQQQLQEFLGKSVLPLFGLDNESATYPFVDLWGLPHGSLQRARELAKALPSDTQMLNLFRSYQTVGFVIYPGITDLGKFESDLVAFLSARQSFTSLEDGVTEQTVYGRSFYWLGMLFAVLASGAQASALTRKERELTSQVYVCCGFECLRFTNFLSQSHIESIQTLLLIGNVMTNNMNAGTAWALLGLTIRLAQGLGVHQACPPHITSEAVFPRSMVWWAIVWQDSLLSITYDRSASLDVGTMPMPQHYGPVSPYHASMYRISKIVLEIVRDRAKVQSARDLVARINQHRDEISNVMRDAASDHLRDSRVCQTSQETLEHWALYLHTSYAMSELCRPAINPRMSNEVVRSFKTICIEHLINVVEAFLGLNNITLFARQSWAAVHRALSSSLLLGILGEHTRNDRARRLLSRFVTLMGDITSTVDPTEISAPVQRGVSALRKLDMDETRRGSLEESNTITLGQNGSAGAAVLDGVLKQDVNQMFTPAHSDTTTNTAEDEHSPYSVLNQILWGDKHGSLLAEAPPM